VCMRDDSHRRGVYNWERLVGAHLFSAPRWEPKHHTFSEQQAGERASVSCDSLQDAHLICMGILQGGERAFPGTPCKIHTKLRNVSCELRNVSFKN
jgi:hypothetical protein